MEILLPRGGQLKQAARGICWDCDYPLQGLVEQRCPECGRPFDQYDWATMNFGPAGALARVSRKLARVCMPILLITICLGFCWLTSLIANGIFSPLAPLPAIYLAMRKKWALLAVFLLLNPFTVALVHYAGQYAIGSPLYVNGNSPVVYPSQSIDPRTRIRGVAPGCGFSRLNVVSNFAESSAGVMMFYLIGPPPGAYTGPYPTEAEAEAALAQSATTIPMDAEMIDSIALPSGRVQLPTSLRCRYQEQPGSVDRQLLAPKMTIWKQRCLIVKVPRDINPKPHGAYSDIFLIDIQKSQMFGMYSQPK